MTLTRRFRLQLPSGFMEVSAATAQELAALIARAGLIVLSIVEL